MRCDSVPSMGLLAIAWIVFIVWLCCTHERRRQTAALAVWSVVLIGSVLELVPLLR